MSLITAVNLSKSYGANDIFSGLSFSIPQHARIGLVGANGVGKTTLIRILAGVEEPSSGEAKLARGLKLGYLPQQSQLTSERSLWEECLTAFEGLLEMQTELRRMENALAGADEALLAAYGRSQHEFEYLGGYTYETRMRQVLAGLGFTQAEYSRPLAKLSGGQRTRAFLARLLLINPDVLLLDEPTNHLDIDAVEWLENYLRDWPGTALIISHDRYFLNQVVNHTWEMTPALEEYRGNYSAYIAQRGERYARRLEEYQAQQEFIQKEEEYIRRNIAGQNTRQAQGRRKRLERLVEEAQLTPPMGSRRLHLNLQPVGRSGDQVLQTRQLVIGYNDRKTTTGLPAAPQVLFRAPDLVLRRGECAAILGPNGAGKTTLLKTLLGQIPPLEGEAELGASLKIGYFAQTHEGLHPKWTLLQEVQAAAPNLQIAEVRDLLAKFMFTGEDVFQQVGSLSGGERSRLALACLSLQGANLLLLDEPTNHLDLPAQEVLQAILADYSGTILLVSHDRYLIDALATQIWDVQPRERSLRIFEGTYSEYRALLETEAVEKRTAEPAAPPAASQAQAHPAAANARGDNRPKTNKEREKIAQRQALEADISQLETELAAVAHQLENPPADAGLVASLGEAYTQLQQTLDERLNEWASLMDA